MNQDIVPVFIPFNATDDLLMDLLNSVNGVLLSGPEYNLTNPITGEKSEYLKTAEKILKYSIDRFENDEESFPVLGISLGF